MDVDMDINVDIKDVCRYLGYSPDVEPSPRIASLLGEYIETARNLIRPAYSYIIKDIKLKTRFKSFYFAIDLIPAFFNHVNSSYFSL